MNECLVCGESVTGSRMKAALSHFRPYERGNWQFLRGNVSAFGIWNGWIGTLGIVFPFFNTIRNWRFRKHTLEFPMPPSGCFLHPAPEEKP